MFHRDYTRTDTLYFRGPDDWLSNFHPCPVTIGEETYQASEYPFQIAKANALDMQEVGQEILGARNASIAKKIAEEKLNHMVEDYQYWHSSKTKIMREIISAKLKSNPHMAIQLRETGNKYLVEDVGDDFWGVGQKGRGGLNMLGKIWMEMRASLPKQQSDADKGNMPYRNALLKPTFRENMRETEQKRDVTEMQNGKHQVLLIGNSQTHNIDTLKFSTYVNLIKVTKYWIKDAQKWLMSDEVAKYKTVQTVVLHLLTNDINCTRYTNMH